MQSSKARSGKSQQLISYAPAKDWKNLLGVQSQKVIRGHDMLLEVKVKEGQGVHVETQSTICWSTIIQNVPANMDAEKEERKWGDGSIPHMPMV